MVTDERIKIIYKMRLLDRVLLPLKQHGKPLKLKPDPLDLGLFSTSIHLKALACVHLALLDHLGQEGRKEMREVLEELVLLGCQEQKAPLASL